MFRPLPESIRIDVPLVLNPRFDCGPVAIEMVGRFFNKGQPWQDIKVLAEPTSTGVTSTFGLAHAAACLGLGVQFATRFVGLSPDLAELPYFKQHVGSFEAEKAKVDSLIERSRAKGAVVEQREYSLAAILERLGERCVPVILLDWNVVRGKDDGYEGHFLPIVGVEGRNVLLHHSGPEAPQAFMPVPFEVVERAHAALGTDRDVLFLSSGA